MYIADIEEAVSRIAAGPLVPDEFPFEFIAAYDAPPATITRIRNGTQNASDVEGGVLWRQKLHLLVCAEGHVEQALSRLQGSRATTTQKAKFLLATDGVEVAARDIGADDTIYFPFSELGDRFGFFLPLAGYSRYKAADDNPIDIKAANRLRRLYDALIAENPEWEGDEMRHAMNLFMTRIIFCMFAEDTGIIPEHLFARTIHDHGGHAGEEMVHVLTSIFTAMSIRESERGDMPKWATDFPWVNGGLFAGDIEVPRFSRTAFRTLTEAAGLRWNEINADIFGSMIQVIVDPAHRHETGMHYTSVPNILKVLDPLFLDELRAEAARPALADSSREKARLKALLARLSKIRVFDPACGSGNFLVIAYQELRKIERQVLDRLRAITGHAPGIWSHIELHNFYGIELSDFAAETAKLSLWIAKFQMDRAHRDVFGSAPPALPLSDSGRIVRDNALRADWTEVCPPPMITRNRQKVFDLATIADVHGTETVPDAEAETFIVGNPPYLGRGQQTPEQKADMAAVYHSYLDSHRMIDFVSCWHLKSLDIFRSRERVSLAFVSTNSLFQGDQVRQFFPIMAKEGLSIIFAHQAFKWSNNAGTQAGVTCVVVGFSKHAESERLLVSGANAKRVSHISPYLIEGDDTLVEPQRSRAGSPRFMQLGNMAFDGGNLLLEQSSYAAIVAEDQRASAFIRRLYGSQEIIKGIERWCLWIPDSVLPQAEKIPVIANRIEATRTFRSNSRDAGTRSLASRPHQFREMNEGRENVIAVPRVSSETRDYIPCEFLSGSVAISDLAYAMYDAPLHFFSLLSSRIHLLWVTTVCGQLETRIRYSNTLGWNTFPIPRLTGGDIGRLTHCAESILLARAELGGALATLYDSKTMPEPLREVHRRNDEVVEKIYSDRSFRSDADRLNHLFRRYTKDYASTGSETHDPEFDLDREEL